MTMRPLAVPDLLDVWEQGLTQPPVQRALALLTVAYADTEPEALARLSIGERDGRLLTLHEWLFGPQLLGLAMCPACGERLELAFTTTDLRVTSDIEPEATHVLEVAGYEVHFRLPNSRDLVAIAHHRDVAMARRALLARCLFTARREGRQLGAEQLPPQVTDAISARMGQADPQADLQLALACPECGHEWRATFDIAAFLWRELHAWANRTLRDVHLLSTHYGWREIDILAMSPQRRQWYLQMVNA
jgi:uncharacterized protein (UPF0212 family)